MLRKVLIIVILLNTIIAIFLNLVLITINEMAYLIHVPYKDKDEAKGLGAYWLQEKKSWSIPNHIQDINPFKKWIAAEEGCIVREPYLLCNSKTNCWKCGQETPMIALAATNYYFYDYIDVNNSDNQEQLWFKAEYATLFSFVLKLDSHVVEYIRQIHPFFKSIYSRTAEQTYFANTCVACGKLQGDFHHHEEPGGAFFPDPYTDEPIKVTFSPLNLEFDYHIDAGYGGMAYDDLNFNPTS